MKLLQTNNLKNFSNLTHTFTTRSDGESSFPYNSLNLAFHVGDVKENIVANHALFPKELNYNVKNLIHMKQIHSNIVHVVEDKDNFLNPPTCDALITDKMDTPLMVMIADCSPILFFDDVKKVIAVAHAGRQGAFSNIVQKVIDSFTQNYNSSVEDILVSVGASIGSCCYEVGEEINREAKNLGFEYAMSKKENSYYLDISSILKTQLLSCGVLVENIEISDECSCCLNEKYFSYRADGITGRFAGVIKLN